MKSIWILLMTLCCTLCLAIGTIGCGKPQYPLDSDSTGEEYDPSLDEGSAAQLGWMKVVKRKTCENTHPNHCPAHFGFSVTRNGQYVAGTDETVKPIKGVIAAEDHQRLNELIAALEPIDNETQAKCEPAGWFVAGATDRIYLKISDAKELLVLDKGGVDGNTIRGTCYRGGKDQVLNLQEHLNLMISKYYPIPFPM